MSFHRPKYEVHVYPTLGKQEAEAETRIIARV